MAAQASRTVPPCGVFHREGTVAWVAGVALPESINIEALSAFIVDPGS